MVNATIAYFAAAFIVTWLVIKLGSKIPLLGLPEVSWVKSFFWTIMIIIATYVSTMLLTSILV